MADGADTEGRGPDLGWQVAAAAAVIGLYLLPLLVWGQDSHARIHDLLEQPPISTARVLRDAGAVFAPSAQTVDALMAPMPRGFLGSETIWPLWGFLLWPPFVAYVVVIACNAVVGTLGFWLLADRVASPRDGMERWIRTGCAVAYGLLPHYVPAGLATAVMPLAVWSLLRVHAREADARDALVMALVALGGGFVTGPLFLLMAAGTLAVLDGLRRRTVPWAVVTVVVLTTVVALLADHRLLWSVVADHGTVTHRVEFDNPRNEGLTVALLTGLIFLFGHYTSETAHWPVVFMVLAIAAWCRRGPSVRVPEADRAWRGARGAVLVALGFAVVYAGWLWGPVVDLREAFFLTRVLNFQRLNWMGPMVWHLALLFGLRVIARSWTSARWVPAALVVAHLGAVFLARESIQEARRGMPTWRAFFAEAQFDEIQAVLDADPTSDRVGSLGLLPSIATYNGLRTVDGYLANYPLEVKHALGRVIAPELERAPEMRWYFDGWGSRAYLFTTHLPYNHRRNIMRDVIHTADDAVVIPDVAFDWDAFRAMGGTHLLSAVEIADPGASGLRLVQVFEHPDSAWRIHLYVPADRAEPANVGGNDEAVHPGAEP